MDWSKTKTIFIIVFAILNVVLYTLYLDRYSEAKNVEVLGDSSIDEKLSADNIIYQEVVGEVEDLPYIQAELKQFTPEDAPQENAQVTVREDKYMTVTFNSPVTLEGTELEEAFMDFAEEVVHEGGSYSLWSISEDKQEAVFFQQVEEHPVYYSDNGKLTVHWNDAGEITHYEQSMYENVKPAEQLKDIVQPMQVLNTLYQQSQLQPNSVVEKMELGYSIFVQVSESTQMLTPTWRVEATLENGETRQYFVNAVKDGVIEPNREEDSTD